MDLLTGDRLIPASADFPQHGNFLLPSPTALIIHSTDSGRQNLPPQKLRPIRGSGRSSPTSSRPGGHLPPFPPEAAGLDGAPEKFGAGTVGGEVGEHFGSPEGEETRGGGENGGGSGGQCLVVGGSVEHGSSLASEDEYDSSAGIGEPIRRKRKKKMRKRVEAFMENLVMKVLERQEQMHQQLIEMIERTERERIIREEAWRQQERERMKQDEQLRAEETSRSLAIISFIQNVMGHEIEVPQPFTATSHVENNGDKHGKNDAKHRPRNSRLAKAEVKALPL